MQPGTGPAPQPQQTQRPEPQLGERRTMRDGRDVVYDGQGWRLVISGPGTATGQPRRLSSTDADFLRDQRDAANAAEGAARAADQFLEINRRQPTGGIQRSLPLATQVESTWNEDIAALQALNNRMAPGLRQPGSGAMSDKDLAIFQRSIPNPDFPGPTNELLAGTIRFNANRQSAYITFLENWAERNGNLMGAQEAWNAMQQAALPLEAGPTSTVRVSERTSADRTGQQFDVTPAARDAFARIPGGLDVRAEPGSARRPVYLGDTPESTLQVGQYAITPDGRYIQGLAPRPVATGGRRSNAPPLNTIRPPAEQQAPVRVQTVEEANRLPPGTRYITPDGQEFTR